MDKCNTGLLFLILILIISLLNGCAKYPKPTTSINNQDLVKIDILESAGLPKNGSVCLFESRIIEVQIMNVSKYAIFLPGVRTGKVILDEYFPPLANYGSPQKDAMVRIDKFNSFLERGKEGEESDKFDITLPDLHNRYQVDSEGNEIDLFEIFSELEEIHETEYARCNYGDSHVPKPSNTMDFGSNDTVWLEPGEKETLYYDVTPFFLRKGTYEFRFILEPDSSASPAKKNNIIYVPFAESIESEELILK